MCDGFGSHFRSHLHGRFIDLSFPALRGGQPGGFCWRPGWAGWLGKAIQMRGDRLAITYMLLREGRLIRELAEPAGLALFHFGV